jgi:hypothetical protein
VEYLDLRQRKEQKDEANYIITNFICSLHQKYWSNSIMRYVRYADETVYEEMLVRNPEFNNTEIDLNDIGRDDMNCN